MILDKIKFIKKKYTKSSRILFSYIDLEKLTKKFLSSCKQISKGDPDLTRKDETFSL